MFINSSIVLLINFLLLTAALLLLIPNLVLLIECFAALFCRSSDVSPAIVPNIAVLVPAHDEALGIKPVLEKLLSQMSAPNRLVVIADNCQDSTAEVARSTGATVIERQDAEQRGKGFALDYGLKFLADNPPDVVIVVDADCDVQPGTLDRIAQAAITTGRPTQAIYLMELPAKPSPKDTVSALAFLVKNRVRPQGLHVLGLPGILTGTGMAFPWSVIRSVSLASGNIVEDMQLSMDLAIAGYPTLFCPDTKVMGLLPQQEQAAKSQRTRWEHGHLQTIRTQVPPLLRAAVQQKRFDLLAIALDLSVPPLSLLVMLWLAITTVALAIGLVAHFWLPAILMLLEGAMILTAILLAWFTFGRSDLPASTLLSIPLYILWKIPLYVAFIIKPQTRWIRTDRDHLSDSKSESDPASS